MPGNGGKRYLDRGWRLSLSTWLFCVLKVVDMAWLQSQSITQWLVGAIWPGANPGSFLCVGLCHPHMLVLSRVMLFFVV